MHDQNNKGWIIIFFILISAVLTIGIFRGESSLETYLKLKKSQKILGDTVKNLESENKKLSDEIQKIKRSKSYAKKVLRDKYHLTEENEGIIFFPD